MHFKNLRDRKRIADVDLAELIARTVVDRLQCTEIAGIRQAVHVDHGMFCVFDQMPDQCRANKARSTRYENLHGKRPFRRSWNLILEQRLREEVAPQ